MKAKKTELVCRNCGEPYGSHDGLAVLSCFGELAGLAVYPNIQSVTYALRHVGLVNTVGQMGADKNMWTLRYLDNTTEVLDARLPLHTAKGFAMFLAREPHVEVEDDPQVDD